MYIRFKKGNDMKITDMGEVFTNVTVMYPRMDKTYKFDSIENRTVPCKPEEDGSAYEVSFVIDKKEAKELHDRAMELFEAAAKKDDKRKWPDKPTYMPMKKSDDGTVYTVKAKLKGNYSGDITRPPLQLDAKREPLPADFQLTTNSKCNVWGVMFAYNTGAVCGVSFRLKGVQVLELAEMVASGDPFEEESGYTAGSSDSDPFGLPEIKKETKEEPAKASADFDDEIPW